ncbi:EcsC family protein [Sporolactobacillus sp. STSJ-5]|uniref:EcsC family protein n=1 Tax=Sporolactobacillus sp. STSJ-5 TaxID=2965076 RepID=UPI002105510A|nr:EcsC family protein [Sporolactobacillus sp. STSJ-5]MCQ2011660.1 EcsC family protein [Sporolactobacillus sp. STSJ-5]
MENTLTESKVGKLLDWAYEKSINGLPGTDTAYDLAQNYLLKYGSVDKAINKLIQWQNTKSATAGFLTGLGGLITLPVAIPADVASVTYVQIRMVAAIAVMRNYDIRDDQVKTFVFLALTGNSVSEILKNAGIKTATQLGKQAIKKVPIEIIKAINKAVGFRLVTKFGEKGIVNLGKAVPLLGGVVGGTMDGMSTNIIGRTAKKIFV